MKVSNVGSGAPTGGSRRVDKADKGKGQFKQALVEAMGSAEESHAIEAPSALGAVDALLVVQAAGDAPDREARQRLVRRGEDILDRLEEIRHGLLMGTVPKDRLVALAQLVRARRETCADPHLAGLLDEIELRAEVEIAKLARTAP